MMRAQPADGAGAHRPDYEYTTQLGAILSVRLLSEIGTPFTR